MRDRIGFEPEGGRQARPAQLPWRETPPVLRLWRDRRGSVAVLAALTLTIMCGVVGLAIDVGLWYRTTRAMQNAADAAAIAAARDGTSTFQATGKAVAARYGFVDGSGGITVTIADNQACPNGTTACYVATVHDAKAPQFFSQVLGITAPPLTSASTVGPNGTKTHYYCLLALAQSGASPAILTDGAPKANMTGCTIMSNTDMTCHGHNLNADIGDAAGTNNGCGDIEHSNVAKAADPYAYMAGQNIPAYSCPSFYHEDQSGNGLPASNVWSGGALALPATTIVCGDLQLGADATITSAAPGSVVVIVNGTLDLNQHMLQTAAGSGLTLVFTGAPGNYSATPYPTDRGGGATLDITAPTAGTWSGVAIYLDPAMPGESITYAGNSPTWNITGLVYMPRASLTFKGSVNKSATGESCFALVVDNITVTGTGSILANGACAAAGLNLPTNQVSGEPALVL